MGLHQRDYVLRMIERIAAVLARALKRRNEGDVEGARDDVRGALAEVLGPAGPMVAMVDPRTAVDLISDPERVTLYARLLEADADLTDAQAGAGTGALARRRALELMLELVLRRVELPDDAKAFVAELEARVDEGALDPRYTVPRHNVRQGRE
jgi:hypothetical protein